MADQEAEMLKEIDCNEIQIWWAATWAWERVCGLGVLSCL